LCRVRFRGCGPLPHICDCCLLPQDIWGTRRSLLRRSCPAPLATNDALEVTSLPVAASPPPSAAALRAVTIALLVVSVRQPLHAAAISLARPVLTVLPQTRKHAHSARQGNLTQRRARLLQLRVPHVSLERTVRSAAATHPVFVASVRRGHTVLRGGVRASRVLRAPTPQRLGARCSPRVCLV